VAAGERKAYLKLMASLTTLSGGRTTLSHGIPLSDVIGQNRGARDRRCPLCGNHMTALGGYPRAGVNALASLPPTASTSAQIDNAGDGCARIPHRLFSTAALSKTALPSTKQTITALSPGEQTAPARKPPPTLSTLHRGKDHGRDCCNPVERHAAAFRTPVILDDFGTFRHKTPTPQTASGRLRHGCYPLRTKGSAYLAKAYICAAS